MQEKYGFVYIWFDCKYKRYYVGCHWGTENDGYVCSSSWMKKAYKHRPQDFRRRILKTNLDRQQMYAEEYRWFGFIKTSEIKKRYYNLNLHQNNLWHSSDADKLTIGQKISASKKGKSSGPCSPETAKKISEAKKKAFAERGGMTVEHKKALAIAKLGSKHTDEWKDDQSQRLKDRWADPVWAEAQRAKLKVARNNRTKYNECS